MTKNYLLRSILSSVVVVAVLIERSSSSENPCVSASQIGDSKRTTTEDPGTCGALCDNYIVNGSWYRLDVSNSGAQMPESCVPVWHCGTYIPIWLNGAHPTEINPLSTTLRVCAQLRTNGDCCEWNSNINVKRCNDGAVNYFVYQLIRPPYCDMAYCAGNGVNCGNSGSWNDIIQKCADSPYPTLDQDPTLIGPYISQTGNTRDSSGNTFTATRFSLKCRLTYTRRQTDDGARYDVVFDTSAGVVYTKTLKSTDEPEVEMDESYLVGHIDQNVWCRATAYWQSAFPKRSIYKRSNSVYIGIKLYANGIEITGPLSVPEGDKINVTLQPTFPITTPACLNPGATPCSPSYTLRVYTSQLYLTNCVVSVSNGSVASFVFSPIANVEKYATQRIGAFQMIPDNTAQAQGSIFNGYISKKYPVSIIEKDWNLCSSSGDPHVKTFSSAYYHIYGVGSYVLVSIPSRKIEVQVYHTPCGTSVSCNCGVIAREGNNILGINNCPGQTSPTFIRYMKDVNNPGGYINSINSNQKAIVLPSGMLISVYVTDWVGYIGVDVNMYGIDGTANRDICSNTLTGPGAECQNECDRYKVQGTNFFNIGQGIEPPCDANAIWVPQCDCSSGGTIGSTCPMPDGNVPLLTYSHTCNLPLSAKRRRSVVEDYSVTIGTPIAVTPPRKVALPASSSNIDLDQARAQCSNALTSSTLYSLCINALRMNVTTDLESCALDVKYLGDLGMPLSLLVTQVEGRCKIVILSSNSTAKDENTKTYDNNYCPSRCSTNGNCFQGTCQCNSEYQGSDCSVRKDAKPTIIKLQSSVCDIRNNSDGCNVVFISAMNVSDNTFKCKITETSSGKVLENPNDRKASANLGAVTCPLPILPVRLQFDRNYSLFIYSINVSLSNNGNNYSNSMMFTVYDGLNVTCDANGCTLKRGAKCSGNRNASTFILLLLIFVLRELMRLSA